MTKYPRLHIDEPEPPAPLPFPGRDAGSGDYGRSAPGRGATGRSMDAAEHAFASIERMQEQIDRLRDMNDDAIASIPFPDHNDDDDGPWAA